MPLYGRLVGLPAALARRHRPLAARPLFAAPRLPAGAARSGGSAPPCPPPARPRPRAPATRTTCQVRCMRQGNTTQPLTATPVATHPRCPRPAHDTPCTQRTPSAPGTPHAPACLPPFRDAHDACHQARIGAAQTQPCPTQPSPARPAPGRTSSAMIFSSRSWPPRLTRCVKPLSM
jgi:hypothetical protein